MRRNGWLWLVLGLVLCAVGVGLYVAGGDGDATEFGWFAYTPLSDDSGFSGAFSSDVVVLTRARLVAGAVAGAGLLVVAATLGYRLGRRREVVD